MVWSFLDLSPFRVFAILGAGLQEDPNYPYSTQMPAPNIPPALTEFARLFNSGAFWEGHEILEVPWKESRSDFYHGLILLASAFVHRDRRNVHGVIAQLDKAQPILQRFWPSYAGVDVDQVMRMVTDLRTLAAGGFLEAGGTVQLSLDPALVRGDEPELDFTS